LEGNNLILLWEFQETHKYILWAECRVFGYVNISGTDRNHLVAKVTLKLPLILTPPTLNRASPIKIPKQKEKGNWKTGQ
jgi:hypothetical protein